MEKRMILALVLSFFVLMAWSFLFGPKQGQGPSKKEETIEKKEITIPEPVVIATPSPAIPSEIAQKGDGIIPKIEEKEIVVETFLYKAIFSNIGAAIKSFKKEKTL